jgi:hypothetical protein
MTEAALLVHIRAIHRELRGAYGQVARSSTPKNHFES